jgi:hypothetical protein
VTTLEKKGVTHKERRAKTSLVVFINAHEWPARRVHNLLFLRIYNFFILKTYARRQMTFSNGSATAHGMRILFGSLFVGLVLCVTHPVHAHGERGELGITVSLEGDITRLMLHTSRWPQNLQPAWQPQARVGGTLSYGLSRRLSVGAGAWGSLPSRPVLSLHSSTRQASSTKQAELQYRQIVAALHAAATLIDRGPFALQVRMDAGPAWVTVTPVAMFVIQEASTASTLRFDLSHEPRSRNLQNFIRLSVPLVWRAHDHVGLHTVPFVSLTGYHQWQLGMAVELEGLLFLR